MGSCKNYYKTKSKYKNKEIGQKDTKKEGKLIPCMTNPIFPFPLNTFN